jgi:predicted RNase H-like HicB family nuclease
VFCIRETEEEALREVTIATELWIATAKNEGRPLPRPMGKEILQHIIDEEEQSTALS